MYIATVNLYNKNKRCLLRECCVITDEVTVSVRINKRTHKSLKKVAYEEETYIIDVISKAVEKIASQKNLVFNQSEKESTSIRIRKSTHSQLREIAFINNVNIIDVIDLAVSRYND